MPRWNGKLDGGGTPPRLRRYARNPVPFEGEVRKIAGEHHCEIPENGVLWDRYGWYVYVTVEGSDRAAKAALEEMEADDVHELMTSEEKRGHPGAVEEASAE